MEEWSKKGLERWVKKQGKSGNQQWHEQWYKKLKFISKKKDEDGNLLLEDDSDGDIEESNCHKWGKNNDTNEEWNEKWGEVHKPEKKVKWCDKWQVDLNNGLKKGENWGQNYDDEYNIINHWAEKWDDKHPENNGVYERRQEIY